ncbi:FprA family A-type flavoprotein [Thermosipho ferrireducens]|uniref:FprA family A-type flavoprotein n=1 Tax=Thermosipho ferrireducens TaxID=2571116 RepID=A0ABX7S792_9BACT|nr:FprA family A-type flavoprotein [Thermosipho ferrireducens]QTA37655.1 FprA family A-type flavoprotein [Thermosipho ferrireducens]
MHRVLKITDDIFYAGVNDRDTVLFENIWPLTKGVSYNSYLIRDEKNVLIDTVKISKVEQFVEKIREVLGGKSLDYLVINHMEPDHSGSISSIIHAFPGVKIIGNKKTREFLKALYGLSDNFVEIKDGEELSLGKHKLKFYITPMVHWPETMMTYEVTEKILFSGDAFGGFGSLDGGIFDDEVDIDYYENEIRRYYSNIVGKFGPMVQKALKKLSEVEIKIIASTHGPIWRSNPQRIIESYDRWSRYEVEEGVVIAYGSMYGNTEKMADFIAKVLAKEGVKNIRVMNSSQVHESFIINEIWRFKGVIFGTSTYNNGIFPPMENLIINLAHKGIKNRIFGVFGTYGWSGGGVKGIVDYIQRNKWELACEPVEVQFSPDEEDFERLREFAKKFVKRLRQI